MTGNLTCQLQSSEHGLIKRIIQGSRAMMRYLLICSTLAIGGLSTALAATTAGNTLQAVVSQTLFSEDYQNWSVDLSVGCRF